MILICLLGFLMSCQPADREIDAKALEVFSEEFIFVGSGQAKSLDNGLVDVTYIAEHGDTEQPKPRKLMKGVQYIFHSRGPMDNESLALKTLPERLSQMGFKIIKAPQSTRELSYPFFGGPQFNITFSDGKHQGVIYNEIDGKFPNKPWIVEAYILVYER